MKALKKRLKEISSALPKGPKWSEKKVRAEDLRDKTTSQNP